VIDISRKALVSRGCPFLKVRERFLISIIDFLFSKKSKMMSR
jgi:hypothetical protein